MAPASDLDTTGTLHGANFAQWKKRTMAYLRLQSLEVYVQHQHQPRTGTDRKWYEKSDRAASFIALLVTPEIITRLSASEQANAYLLMQRLESMCTHFRFLDLSSEVRKRIYDLVLDCDRYALGKARARKAEITGYPTITRVSKQIRDEVLPIFYSNTTFKFFYESDRSNGIDQAREWFVHTAKDHVIHVQSISVTVPLLEDPKNSRHMLSEFRFKCTENDGLQIECPVRLTAQSKSKIETHERNVEAACDWFGNSGTNSILFFALFTNEGMWKSGQLTIT